MLVRTRAGSLHPLTPQGSGSPSWLTLSYRGTNELVARWEASGAAGQLPVPAQLPSCSPAPRQALAWPCSILPCSARLPSWCGGGGGTGDRLSSQLPEVLLLFSLWIPHCPGAAWARRPLTWEAAGSRPAPQPRAAGWPGGTAAQRRACSRLTVPRAGQGWCAQLSRARFGLFVPRAGGAKPLADLSCSIPSRPTPSHPVPSHPTSSHPVPSRPTPAPAQRKDHGQLQPPAVCCLASAGRTGPGAAAWQGAVPVPVPVPVPGPSQGWCGTARRPGAVLGCWVAWLGSLWPPPCSLTAGSQAAPSPSLGMPADRPGVPGQADGSQDPTVSGAAAAPARPRLGGQPRSPARCPAAGGTGWGEPQGCGVPAPCLAPCARALFPVCHAVTGSDHRRECLPCPGNLRGGELSQPRPQPRGRGELAAHDTLDRLLTKRGAKSAQLFWGRQEVCETFGRDLPAGCRVTTAERLGLFQETRGAGRASRTLGSAAGCSTEAA